MKVISIIQKATQLERRTNQLENNKVDVGSLRENDKEFIKNNVFISKSQKIVRKQKHNVFTTEVNKI